MKRKIFLGIMLFLLVFSIFADYVSIFGITSWSRVDSHKIIVYRGSTPIALIEVRFAFIYQTSKINFPKDYIGPYDKIIIDGEVYDITKVSRL